MLRELLGPVRAEAEAEFDGIPDLADAANLYAITPHLVRPDLPDDDILGLVEAAGWSIVTPLSYILDGER